MEKYVVISHTGPADDGSLISRAGAISTGFYWNNVQISRQNSSQYQRQTPRGMEGVLM